MRDLFGDSLFENADTQTDTRARYTHYIILCWLIPSVNNHTHLK